MRWSRSHLEYLTLLCIDRYEGWGYAAEITRALTKATGRPLAYGAVRHFTSKALEQRWAQRTEEREGPHWVCRLRLTSAGEAELAKLAHEMTCLNGKNKLSRGKAKGSD